MVLFIKFILNIHTQTGTLLLMVKLKFLNYFFELTLIKFPVISKLYARDFQAQPLQFFFNFINGGYNFIEI